MRMINQRELTVILQLVGTQTYDLSAYGSKEEAWAAEKGEWWVEQNEDIDAARLEFMGTLYEYSQEEVVSAAFDEQAWPFDWGYVTEENETEENETEENETVHCLVCDCTYPEKMPTVKACPHCGNSDKNQTVYLSKENDMSKENARVSLGMVRHELDLSDGGRRQDRTAAGDLEDVDTCAFEEKLKVCLPDYEEEV
jgi:hypothetical protein